MFHMVHTQSVRYILQDQQYCQSVVSTAYNNYVECQCASRECGLYEATDCMASTAPGRCMGLSVPH